MSDSQAAPQPQHTPVVVIVRDGWGRNPNPEHDAFNAVKQADTPRCDDLLDRYASGLIHTSGEDVGLPAGTMGNSEVGHQNIGAGRVVDQESVRITKAIRTGDFFENPALVEAVEFARSRGGYVHLLGIASDAGVHGLMTHLYACLELCKKYAIDRVALHLFTDGRDTGPYTGIKYIQQIEAEARKVGVGRVASVVGRYYAMDRDNRWERVKRAYELLTGAVGDPAEQPKHFATAAEAMRDYYDNPTNDSQHGDEFITPRTVGDNPASTRISDGDAVIFYNYRGDRPREITRAFMQPDFFGNVPPSPDTDAKGFDRGEPLDIRYVCMTAYEEQFAEFPGLRIAFTKPPKMSDIGGEYLSKRGLKQFRCAESEKGPHVTFFFNDYRDQPFAGEDRAIVPSPKVATYDVQPDMSAPAVRDQVLEALDADYALIVVNFANGDMVGHTGKFDAAVKAIETVDGCVGQIVDKTLNKGGQLIVTADHGNAEQMYDPDTDAAHTAHTRFDVECILVGAGFERGTVTMIDDGRLADIFPTALKMMGLPQPEAMTGRALY